MSKRRTTVDKINEQKRLRIKDILDRVHQQQTLSDQLDLSVSDEESEDEKVRKELEVWERGSAPVLPASFRRGRPSASVNPTPLQRPLYSLRQRPSYAAASPMQRPQTDSASEYYDDSDTMPLRRPVSVWGVPDPEAPGQVMSPGQAMAPVPEAPGPAMSHGQAMAPGPALDQGPESPRWKETYDKLLEGFERAPADSGPNRSYKPGFSLQASIQGIRVRCDEVSRLTVELLNDVLEGLDAPLRNILEYALRNGIQNVICNCKDNFKEALTLMDILPSGYLPESWGNIPSRMNYENLQRWIMNKLDEDEHKYEESKGADVTIMENIQIMSEHLGFEKKDFTDLKFKERLSERAVHVYKCEEMLLRMINHGLLTRSGSAIRMNKDYLYRHIRKMNDDTDIKGISLTKILISDIIKVWIENIANPGDYVMEKVCYNGQLISFDMLREELKSTGERRVPYDSDTPIIDSDGNPYKPQTFEGYVSIAEQKGVSNQDLVNLWESSKRDPEELRRLGDLPRWGERRNQ